MAPGLPNSNLHDPRVNITVAKQHTRFTERRFEDVELGGSITLLSKSKATKKKQRVMEKISRYSLIC